LNEYIRKTRRKRSHTPVGEEDIATEELCDDKQREEMLDGDEILLPKNAFIQGRGDATKKRKAARKPIIKTQCLELAENEYEED
jgi:hypothetical protein